MATSQKKQDLDEISDTLFRCRIKSGNQVLAKIRTGGCTFYEEEIKKGMLALAKYHSFKGKCQDKHIRNILLFFIGTGGIECTWRFMAYMPPVGYAFSAAFILFAISSSLKIVKIRNRAKNYFETFTPHKKLKYKQLKIISAQESSEQGQEHDKNSFQAQHYSANSKEHHRSSSEEELKIFYLPYSKQETTQETTQVAATPEHAPKPFDFSDITEDDYQECIKNGNKILQLINEGKSPLIASKVNKEMLDFDFCYKNSEKELNLYLISVMLVFGGIAGIDFAYKNVLFMQTIWYAVATLPTLLGLILLGKHFNARKGGESFYKQFTTNKEFTKHNITGHQVPTYTPDAS